MSSPQPAAGAAASAPLSKAEVRRIIYSLMMAMMLGALDQTIVATAMPTIGRDLHDTEHLPWVVTAYLLAATSATPLYGKLSDIHGRRPMFMISISVFLAGSVLCAIAPTMLVLILARLVQGIGGGGLLALSQTIAGDILSPKERAAYQGYFATAFTFASVAGPVLGGFFAQHLHWSMIFWINIPIGIAGVLLSNKPLQRLPRHERPHKLDIPGAVLLIASTSGILLTLNWGIERYSVASPQMAGMTGLSLLLLLGFFYRLRHTDEPLIPLEILSNRVVLVATLAASFSVGLFLGLAIYVPILFESIRGLSASESGIALIPLMVGTVGGSLMAGKTLVRYRHYKRLPLSVLPFAALAAIAMLFGAGACPVWVLSVLLGIISIAFGTILPISTLSIQNAVPFHQLGTAIATANLCRQLAGAVSVAVFGVIIIGTGSHEMASHVLPVDKAVLLSSFRFVFALAALGSAGAFVTMMRLEERPLTGPPTSDTAHFSAGE